MSTMTVPRSVNTEEAPTGGIPEVFSINFLRSESIPLRTRRIVIYAALGYLAVNVLLAIGFAGVAVYSSLRNWSLEAQSGKVVSLAASEGNMKQEMQVLYERALQDLNRLNSASALTRRRFLFSGKLEALTRTLPSRTWITGISGERGSRTLVIQATYVADPAKPYELPTKVWMQTLKTDPGFSGGLKRLDLGTTSQKKLGGAELFLFELIAEWIPAAEH